MDPGCGSAHGDLLAQRQNPGSHDSVLREAHADRPGRPRSATAGKGDDVYATGLIDAGWIQVSGIETQRQIVSVLAGEVPRGNCSNDLGECKRAEIRRETRGEKREAGRGCRTGSQIPGNAERCASERRIGLAKGSKLTVLAEFQGCGLGC